MANLDQMLNLDFWNNLGGELSLCEMAEYCSSTAAKVDSKKVQKERERQSLDGYFQFEEILNDQNIECLKLMVERLEKEGFPPVFLCLYDKFWQTLFDLRMVAKDILGEDYLIFPDLWVWHLNNQESEAGWTPHRDEKVESNDRDCPTTSITLWVSLTDATPDNGCMYVLPKSLDTGYPSSLEFDLKTLQNVRALPIKSASVIGWNQSVFHWGGRSSTFSKNSRMSFACELQPVSRENSSEAMLDPNKIPSFEKRLKIVAMQLRQYRHLHSENQLMMSFANHFGDML